MAEARASRERRPRGAIDVLPNGSLRVRVYAGVDPVTKKRHGLVAVIPAGPRAEDEAEAQRHEFLRQLDERRNPRTKATLDQLLTRYLDQFDGASGTKSLYERHVRNHISPLLGHVKVAVLDADALDSFYAELRRCRRHCTGRRSTDHRVETEHECDHRCRPHRCKPLSASSIRHMHFILSGAYKKAVRWRWVSMSPMSQAAPPPAPTPNPQPPTPEQAARILNEAWRNPEWGTLLWLAITTGARRGELCAVRWSSINLEPGRETLWLRHAITRTELGWTEGGLKTHQQRRIALDMETSAILSEHRDLWAARFAGLGQQFNEDGYVFANIADGAEPPSPDGGYSAIRAARRSDQHSNHVPQAAALFGDRANSRRNRYSNCGGPPRARWRRINNAAGVYRMGVRSRPTSCWTVGVSNANQTSTHQLIRYWHHLTGREAAVPAYVPYLRR